MVLCFHRGEKSDEFPDLETLAKLHAASHFSYIQKANSRMHCNKLSEIQHGSQFHSIFKKELLHPTYAILFVHISIALA